MPESKDHPGQLSILKQAFLKLEEMEERLRAAESARTEPIAIIGIGCRLPGGAISPHKFWNLLKEGADAVGEVPSDRWKIDEYYDSDPGSPGKMSTRYGAFLDGVDQFDPQFFGIAPREAASMDPQQRLLLEVSWEALEHAAQAPDSLEGSHTGVYVGICTNDYETLRLRDGALKAIDTHYASGIAHSIISGRLSYFLGTMGPSISIDTACSSSLVAIHLACQSLRTGEIDMALAGGVNTILAPENTVALSKAGMMAEDGRCKTFDAAADGFVRGEGCAIVVLKRLSDALRNGDHILALIRGSAVNHDGPSSGLTVPNGPAQEIVILRALDNAGIDPLKVDYVECHGTGTSLGDPIEVQSLMNIYGKGRTESTPLLIGSVKTNLGHLEAVAGIAGLIKVVLALQAQEIPAHLHFTKPNPYIDWKKFPIKVVTELTAWPCCDRARRAAVSSFGFSGTNAHLVLEEAPPVKEEYRRKARDRSAHLLCLSARDSSALNDLTECYQSYLRDTDDNSERGPSTGDLCYSANAGRKHFTHRLAVIGGTNLELHQKLSAYLKDEPSSSVFHGIVRSEEPPDIAFLFSGQGSQYIDMGRKLYESEPLFKKTLDWSNELLAYNLSPPLLSAIFPSSGMHDLINRTTYTHPALFAVEYALAMLWKSWGISPSIVMGHGVGEYAAACIAGVFSPEDALKLVAKRARLIDEMTPEGAMVAVFAGDALLRDTLNKLEGRLCVTAVNGHENTVIAGLPQDVTPLLAQLDGIGVKYLRIKADRAFHSPFMSPVLDELRESVSGVQLSPPQIQLISNVTGKLVEPEEICDPSYWCQHLCRPVEFFKAMGTLAGAKPQILLEIGPSPLFLDMGGQCLAADEQPILKLASLSREKDEWQELLESLAVLYCAGADIKWKGYDRGFIRRRTPLPTYPFRHKRYWAPGMQVGANVQDASSMAIQHQKYYHPLLGRAICSPLISEKLFEASISTHSVAFVGDHKIFGQTVVPATAYVEMAVAAATNVFGEAGLVLEDIVIQNPLVLYEGQRLQVQTVLVPTSDASGQNSRASFKIISFDDNHLLPQPSWQLHAEGNILHGSLVSRPSGEDPHGWLEEVKARCLDTVNIRDFYDNMRGRGMQFGPSFRGVTHLQRCDGEAIGHIRLPEVLKPQAGSYRLHPAVLDACLQTFAASRFSQEELKDGDFIYMPIGIEKLVFYSRPKQDLISHFKLRQGQSENTVSGDATIMSETGEILARVEGLSFRRVDESRLIRRSLDPEIIMNDWLYTEEWVEAASGRAMHAIAEAADPTELHTPQEIQKSLQAADTEIINIQGVNVYDAMMPELDHLCTQYILGALKELGWSMTKSGSFLAEDLFEKLGVARRHYRLAARMLEILAEDGILQQKNEQWEVAEVAESSDTELLIDDLLMRYPEGSGELGLLKNSGPRIAENLRRDEDPLETLFPDGSFAPADQLYRRSPAARVMNLLLSRAVKEIVGLWIGERPIRILEIGAGTGGTTSFLLPVLPHDRVEYCFTDISPLFVSRAKDEFRQFGCMLYKVLDIERNLADQGFEANSADIIVAANVLHATTELSSTLANVRKLLRPGGMLVMLEGTRPLRWIDLTFGFTEGWWKFSDREARKGYPLVDYQTWSSLLQANGFQDVARALPERYDGPLGLNAMILAQRPRYDSQLLPMKQGAEEQIWIVFPDAGGLGSSVAEKLRSETHACVEVLSGELCGRQGDDLFALNPARQEDYNKLILTVREQSRNGAINILHFGAIEEFDELNLSAERIMASQENGSQSILYMVQALAKEGITDRAKMWLFTMGARKVGNRQARLWTPHATIWGLGKVIPLEHPDMTCIRVDLDPSPNANHLKAVLDSLKTQDEEEIAYREDRRFSARLQRCPQMLCKAHLETGDRVQTKRLVVLEPGALDSLRFESQARKPIGNGEVEIEVKATGLNFRDVLIALGMYPGGQAPIGGECSGIIREAGSGVTGLYPGDEVIAMAPSSFDSLAIADAELVVKKPRGMNFDDAATVLSGYLTAYYCLHHLAGLTEKDRVLIHAAAGGVGLSTVYLAQRTGAEVYATAGSPQKRDYLRSLGVRYVSDSRTFDFVQDIEAWTEGRGVDVVLNSLTGDFIARNLKVLRPGGRYVEIGKRDIWDESQVRAHRSDVAYHLVDLAETGLKEPHLVGSILRLIVRWIEDKELPVLPKKVFKVERVTDAFRYMMQAKHIGKIVVSRGNSDDGELPQATLAGKSSAAIKPDGTYLVTGGLGGIGLRTASWLAARGARHLVLMGRNPGSEIAVSAVAKMKNSGVSVRMIQGDVTKKDDVARVLGIIRSEMPQLNGIIHSAGVLDDATLLRQTWETFERVLVPKVLGAWHLHCLTKSDPLDFFILFSSIAGLLGSRGQSNHAAANAFLDSFAHYRKLQGLPALSINWGAWTETGAAARHKVESRVRLQGIDVFSPDEAFIALQNLLPSQMVQVGVMPVSWDVFLAQRSSGRNHSSYFASFLEELDKLPLKPVPRKNRHESTAFMDELAATPIHKLESLIRSYIRKAAIKVMALDDAAVFDDDQPLQELGLDSLMAVELRNVLKSGLKMQKALPTTLVFDHPTISRLTAFLYRRVTEDRQEPLLQEESSQTDEITHHSFTLDQVEELTDDEVDRLLAERIQ